MGCKDTVLPDPLLKNHSVKCLTFEENTWKRYNDNLCLLRALAFHSHGNERLGEHTFKLFNRFPEKNDGIHPANFRCVCVEEIAAVQDLFQADICLYDIDIVDGFLMRELAGRSAGKYSNTVRFLRYISQICMYPVSTLSSKPIVFHLVVNSSKQFFS